MHTVVPKRDMSKEARFLDISTDFVDAIDMSKTPYGG